MKIKTPVSNRTHESTPSTRGRDASPEQARREHAAAPPILDAPRALSLLSAGDPTTRHRGAMAVQRLIGNRATREVLGRLSPSIHEAAQAGVRGSGGTMPHFDTIQRAFGRHDIRHVQAYTDPAASSACRSIGAEAYATGSKVAFSGPPSLRTAAHEAAHTVQQQAGVQLKGGVGETGDRYERHADAVADAVTQGGSAEALLDEIHAQTGPAASAEAPVQRMLTKLGWMNDEAHLVSLKELAGVMEAPLPDLYARFLPALAGSTDEYMFATDESGKVTLKQAEDVIASAKDSFVVSGTMWSFVLPDDGWQDMQSAKENAGTDLVPHEAGRERSWFVTMDLSLLPHVTKSVVEGVKKLEIAARTPAATMILPTGLTYQTIVHDAGPIEELGVLGNLVLSVTPPRGDTIAQGVARSVRTWFKKTYACWEPMQMDPRHMGTHDKYNMGVENHYHLVLPGGVSKEHTDGVISKFEEYYDAAMKREAKLKEMSAFLKVLKLSPSDKKQKDALVAERNKKNGINLALKLWDQIKETLDWWKQQQGQQ